MSFDDDSTDEPVGFRPPPHPDDRLWRHPSELRSNRRTPAQRVPAHRARAHGRATSPPRWATAAVATLGAGLVAVGAGMLSVGLRDGAVNQGPVIQAMIAPVAGDPGVPSPYAIANSDSSNSQHVDLAMELSPSVVRVDGGTARGSGVIVGEEGLVLTSAAVVGAKTHLAVALGDGRLLTGTVVGTDELTGVAVVDLPGDDYTATELGEVPTSTIYGREALALGVDDSGRLVLGAGEVATTPSRVERPGLPTLDGVLVISAAADPVAQGGPVVDEAGNLVGLTVWSAGGQSYAAPNAVLHKVVNDLLATGTVAHTWLGIDGYDAADNGWPAGVGVAGVTPAGPAAGILRAGDVIVAIDQQIVTRMPSLVIELHRHDPGDVVELSYRRSGQPGARSAAVVLAPRPVSLDV